MSSFLIYTIFPASVLPDALPRFEGAVGDDGVVADDGLAGGQDLGSVVRVPHAIPEGD